MSQWFDIIVAFNPIYVSVTIVATPFMIFIYCEDLFIEKKDIAFTLYEQ